MPYPEYYTFSGEGLIYSNIPVQVNGMDYVDYIASLETCLETKGNAYYKKISGGMRCSNIELVKLELIIYLLKRYSSYNENSHKISLQFGGSTCLYNGSEINGVTYGQIGFKVKGKGEVQLIGLPSLIFGTETYLKTFILYASEFCKECIISNPIPAAAVPASTAGNLYGEDGTTPITLETGGSIKL